MQFVAPKAIRPTTGKVRQAIFNVLLSLGADFENADCLDLFAGSGALGIEALFQGAKTLVSIDSSFESCKAINQNLEKAKQKHKAKVLKQNALKFNSSSTYQLIFADPPYELPDKEVEALFANVCEFLSEDGIFIFEFTSRWPAKESQEKKFKEQPFNKFELLQHKNYGDTAVMFFKRAD